MSDNQIRLLQEKVVTAQMVVDRLVSICSGFESVEWMAKFIAVQKALSEGRLRDGVREESRLTDCSVLAKWVISFELERVLEKAMGVLHRQLHYPDHSEAALVIDALPSDVTALGTREQQREVFRIAFENRIHERSMEGVLGAYVAFSPEELANAYNQMRRPDLK